MIGDWWISRENSFVCGLFDFAWSGGKRGSFPETVTKELACRSDVKEDVRRFTKAAPADF